MRGPRRIFTRHITSLFSPVLLGALAVVVCLGWPLRAQNAEDIRAIVAQVEGMVTVAAAGASSGSSLEERGFRRAVVLQVLDRGDAVRLPRGSSLGLVCSNERWIELQGVSTWRVDKPSCQGGRPLPPGTFGSLEPRRGRLRKLGGALALEGGIRGEEGDDPRVPSLLYPRRTAILRTRPEIVWAAGEGAAVYEVQVSGSHSWSRRVPADGSFCRALTSRTAETLICRISYPAEEPALQPGESYYLRVAARDLQGLAWFAARQPERFTVLTAQQAARVQERWGEISSLPLPVTVRDLLRANVAVGRGLQGRAIQLYEGILRRRRIAEVEVTLGDLYRLAGLWSRAYDRYAAALECQPSVAGRAAAELGLGSTLYAQGRYREALVHLRHALESGPALDEETHRAVERAMEQARRRLPLDPRHAPRP